MQFKKISNQLQWIMLGTAALILLGIYTYFRFIPAFDGVSKMNTQLTVDQALLERPNIPEAPAEDSTYLKTKLDRLDKELALVAGRAENLAQRLAPEDSQEVLLTVSQLARTSRVKMVQNLPYLVQRRVKINPDTGEKSKKKLSPAEERKRLKKLRKQAKRAKKNTAKFGGVVGALTREGELMDKLVNDFEEARPLQEIVVEGGFANLKTFIQGIQALPWQVTIVKLDIETTQLQKVPQGLPQPLKAKMIIGM